MKDFCDLVRVRRSIRKFQDRAVEPDKLKEILKAVLMAPSSKRSQPWQFVVVDKKEKLTNIDCLKNTKIYILLYLKKRYFLTFFS